MTTRGMVFGGNRDHMVCLVRFTIGIFSEQDHTVGGGPDVATIVSHIVGNLSYRSLFSNGGRRGHPVQTSNIRGNNITNRAQHLL